MRTIKYKAINTANKIITGSVSMENSEDLEAFLNEQDLRLISYRLMRKMTYKTLTYKQQEILWMSLRHYMMSNFTLINAIKYLKQGIADKGMQSILHDIYQKLKQGEMLSQAVKQYLPKREILTTSLLETAERTGDYVEILHDLESYAGWQINFRGEIKQSMRYPTIVFGALWVSIFCILYFFAPQLSMYFHENMENLPMLTLMLIQTSQFVVQRPTEFLALPFILFIAIKCVGKISPVSHAIGFYLPGIRTVWLGYYYTFISKVLYLQLRHGHSLVESFENLQKIYALDWIGPTLKRITYKIQQGVPLTNALQQNNQIFSNFFLQLIEVGEKSNTLSENLKVISAYYEKDTRKKLLGYVKLIEPLMLVLMGGLLLIVVGGLFYPMYQQVGTMVSGGL